MEKLSTIFVIPAPTFVRANLSSIFFSAANVIYCNREIQ